MNLWKEFKGLKKNVRRTIYSGCALLCYTLLGFFLLPVIIHPIIVKNLSESLDRNIHLKELKINPFTLSATLNEFTIDGKHSKKLLSIQQLVINFQATALINKIIAFDEISIIQPNIDVLLLKNGNINFHDLIVDNASNDNSVQQQDSDWTIAVDMFRYVDGSIDFTDKNRQKLFHHKFQEISVILDNFSTDPIDHNTHHIKVHTADGAKLDWQGKFNLSPLKSSGVVHFLGKLDVVSDYLAEQTLLKVTNGSIEINSHYSFSDENSLPQLKLTDTVTSIKELAVNRKLTDEKILAWDDFTFDLKKLNSETKELIFNSITSNGISILISKDKQANVDFGDLFVLQKLNTNNDDKASSVEENEKNWALKIEEINHSNANVIITDQLVSPIAVHNIAIPSLKLTNLQPFSDEPATLNVNFLLNKQGNIDINGIINPESKRLTIDLAVDSLSLKPYQSYVNEVALVDVISGELSTNLNLVIDASNDIPDLNITGTMNLNNLKLMDNKQNNDYLSWVELGIDGIIFNYPEQRVSLNSIEINEPSLRVFISDDGKINLQEILLDNNNNTDESLESNKAGNDFHASIDKINITDGKIDFSDHSLGSNFNIGMYSLNGDISALSSDNSSRATIDLRGKIDRYAPVTIKGTINPLSVDTFADINMFYKGIELTTFTPYSGKFAGYKIDKGKLSLELDYKLSNNKLVAENRVILDQLTLGEAVDSNAATSLPVKFALSLLKDANGVIDFNLPIRGDLENPDFHYGSLVWGALGNLVVGIVSSPFRALASLAGGSDEVFDNVVFSANSSEISDTEKNKLNLLSKALVQRPSLSLEIRGLSSNMIDHDEMASLELIKKLQLLSSPSVYSLSDEDQAVVIAYYKEVKTTINTVGSSDQTDPKPEDVITFDKAVQYLIAETDVSEESYLLLAKQRALEIQKYLIEVGKVSAANIYLLDSSTSVDNDNIDVVNNQLIVLLGLISK